MIGLRRATGDERVAALGDRIAVLRAGLFVQIGTPTEMWRRPVDTFVARAIGQPEMNLIDAHVEGDRIVMTGSGVTFPAPDDMGLVEGEKLRLGMRPNELHVVPAGTPAPSSKADQCLVPAVFSVSSSCAFSASACWLRRSLVR